MQYSHLIALTDVALPSHRSLRWNLGFRFVLSCHVMSMLGLGICCVMDTGPPACKKPYKKGQPARRFVAWSRYPITIKVGILILETLLSYSALIHTHKVAIYLKLLPLTRSNRVRERYDWYWQRSRVDLI